MGTKSKLFRAFVEGNTISDGRQITAEMINDIVATFNLDTYTPRINIEHISGYSPEPPFNGYGDVIAVEARDDDIVIDGKSQKRRALYVQVEGNDQLTALAERGQKPFASVEITDSYAGCGKTGLIGLAFTDIPASIGTQKLHFSRRAPGTLFSTGMETAIEFDAVSAPAGEATGLIAAMTTFFKQFAAGTGQQPEPVTPPKPAKDEPANDNDARFAQIGEGLVKMAAVLESMNTGFTAQIGALKTDFAAVKQSIDTTEKPGQHSRQPASGGDGRPRADC